MLLDSGIQISMNGKGGAYDKIFIGTLWRTSKYNDMKQEKGLTRDR
jgi:hypothetical protein